MATDYDKKVPVAVAIERAYSQIFIFFPQKYTLKYGQCKGNNSVGSDPQGQNGIVGRSTIREKQGLPLGQKQQKSCVENIVPKLEFSLQLVLGTGNGAQYFTVAVPW